MPLAAVADLNQRPGREHIQRDNRLTSVWVTARYEEGTREEYMPLVEAGPGRHGLPLRLQLDLRRTGSPASRSSRRSS